MANVITIKNKHFTFLKAKFKPICIELVNKQLHNYYEVYLDHVN